MKEFLKIMVKQGGLNIMTDQDKKKRKLLQIMVGQQLTEIKSAEQLFNQLKDFTVNPDEIDLATFKKQFTSHNPETGFNPVIAMLQNNFLPMCIESFGIEKWKDNETEDQAIKYAYREKCSIERRQMVEPKLQFHTKEEFMKKLLIIA